MFCVRAKQPYSSDSIQFEQQSDIKRDVLPVPNAKLGEICAFMRDKMSKIGKVLQFSKYKNKRVSSRQFKGSSAMVDKEECKGLVFKSGSTLKLLSVVYYNKNTESQAHKLYI